MKILILALAALSTFGQGTINFHTTLNEAHAIPPNSSELGGWGAFTLEPGNLFYAGVQVGTVPNAVSSVALFRATTSTDIGTHLFDIPFQTSIPGIDVEGQGYGLASVYVLSTPATLTPAQVGDLESGYWWVSVITPGFPNGEIRGQITAVPEPSTYALLGRGAFAILLIAAKDSVKYIVDTRINMLYSLSVLRESRSPFQTDFNFPAGNSTHELRTAFFEIGKTAHGRPKQACCPGFSRFRVARIKGSRFVLAQKKNKVYEAQSEFR